MNRSPALLAVLMAGTIVAGMPAFAQSSAGASHAGHGAPAAAQPAGAGKVLYYRNPMGLPDTSPVPKRDSMGMEYVPVYEGEAAPVSVAAPAQNPAGPRKILYYRNPMGLPDTSAVPKKDPMGMDYVPVYEGEDSASGTVTISSDKVQKLGVRTDAAMRRAISRQVRAVGTVQVDERRLFVVAPKFEAWIERLLVDTTGDTVRKGQPLMEVYSPELVLAQQEYLVARQGGAQLAEASLQRLRNLDVPEEEIDRLRKTGKASRTLTYRAAAGGVVLEKSAVRGMRFMPGEALYRIADLTHVWLVADVFEQDLGYVKPGQDVDVTVNSLPGKTFTGKVSFVYPTLTAESRTGKVRVELPNADGLLKPNLYATVHLNADLGAMAGLAVPDSALLDTGKRQAVLVEIGEGRYEPRDVKAGARADGYVQILAGLEEGERVVVRANFLIDSESNLRAALSAFGGSGGQHQQH
ncbi:MULTISPECIES: efflux RND transporter periplasmic adaptor subunit [unclassified Azospirillum]|uniref:efflux RND transporter periplasmic adaptor subunit n=1 Tax=unclassified Azospirillum TaxID=2630922 RepID=UPI001FFEEBD0|nr:MULTISPECIES: efflux RND transporter periplasmic adaptor subunit [unclassified Azospirillum]MDR6774776.1 Cu(I)/Ag(I) efflux system membrane fusion protein [Azospirillum sp. BE72]